MFCLLIQFTSEDCCFSTILSRNAKVLSTDLRIRLLEEFTSVSLSLKAWYQSGNMASIDLMKLSTLTWEERKKKDNKTEKKSVCEMDF